MVIMWRAYAFWRLWPSPLALSISVWELPSLYLPECPLISPSEGGQCSTNVSGPAVGPAVEFLKRKKIVVGKPNNSEHPPQ